MGKLTSATSLFRVTSLFTQATTFALYLSLLIPLAFYRCWYARGIVPADKYNGSSLFTWGAATNVYSKCVCRRFGRSMYYGLLFANCVVVRLPVICGLLPWRRDSTVSRLEWAFLFACPLF